MSNDVRQRLLQQIREWNINRLDLFALSEPNQVPDLSKWCYVDNECSVSGKKISLGWALYETEGRIVEYSEL